MVVGQGITLEYKMKKGESLKYQTIVDSDQFIREGENKAEQKSVLEMVMVQKAIDVAADGTISVDVIIESGTVKRDGETEELPNVGQVISMKMRKNGEITQTSVEFPFSQPPFPSTQIQKGGSWTGTSKVNIPGRAEPITLTYNYTLVGFEKVSGYDCARIEVICPESKISLAEGVDQKLVAKGTTFFAHNEGRLVHSEVETNTEIMGPDAEVKTKIKVMVDLQEKKVGPSMPEGEAFIIK